MMLKERSNPWARAKYLYVLPLAVIAVSAFARPEISSELEQVSAVKVSNLVGTTDTKIAEIPPVAQKDTLRVITNSKNEKDEKGIVVAGKILEVRGESDSDNVKYKVIDSASRKQPLLVVDGKEVPSTLRNAIDPKYIKSMNVLKGDKAREAYGEKGINGVFELTLKNDEQVKGNWEFRKDKASSVIKIYDAGKMPEDILILFDGKKVDALDEIDADNIDRVDVYKYPSSLSDEQKRIAAKYNYDISKGVVIIRSKKK